jgi:hypothetical protein
MTEYPALKVALRDWGNQAIPLLKETRFDRYQIRDPRWWRDSDDIFREGERVIDVWDHSGWDRLFSLPAWQTVLGILHADEQLNRQIDTLVGTAYGGVRVEASSVGWRVLPSPNDLDDFSNEFDARYERLEEFLVSDDIEYSVIWPLQGLTASKLPVSLEPMLELGSMTERELGFALDTELVRTVFPRTRHFKPGPEHRTCIRYRYSLPKYVGSREPGRRDVLEQTNSQLQYIALAVNQTFALVVPETIGVAGSFRITSAPDGPLSQGVSYGGNAFGGDARMRQVRMTDDHISAFAEVWRRIRQPGLMQEHKGLALALRRLSYQAQRHRPEDAFLDMMIAAEALYLSDLGKSSELRYRLALRAALLVEPQQVGFTRAEVMGLMKSAYDARSAIAHGGNPDRKELKVQGKRVSLAELASAAKTVIASASQIALARAASSAESWPPDWDSLVLGAPRQVVDQE